MILTDHIKINASLINFQYDLVLTRDLRWSDRSTWLKLPLVLPVSMVKQRTREQQNSIETFFFQRKLCPCGKSGSLVHE